MRCSCKACGAYMVQRERGLESGCCCPACGNVCRDCMGSVSGPLDVAACGTGFPFCPRRGRIPGWRRRLGTRKDIPGIGADAMRIWLPYAKAIGSLGRLPYKRNIKNGNRWRIGLA